MGIPLVVHYGHHVGTTGSHFAEAAERRGLGRAWPSGHREHVVIGDRSPDRYLWIESGVTSLPTDAHRTTSLTAGYLIDAHLHLDLTLLQAMLFDVVFVAQKDLVPSVAAVHPQAHWLPLASPVWLTAIERGCRFDVGFVGNAWPSTNRAALMGAVERRLKTNDWRRPQTPEQMGVIYANSRLVVNPAVAMDLNMRFFEGLACDAAVVMPDVGNGADEIAVRDRDFYVVDFSDVETVVDRLHELTTGSMPAPQGRAIVAGGHTYDHRIEQVLQVLGSAEHLAPVRTMSAAERGRLLLRLAHAYRDRTLLTAAVRAAPSPGVLPPSLLVTTAGRVGAQATKDLVKRNAPSLANNLRRLHPNPAP